MEGYNGGKQEGKAIMAGNRWKAVLKENLIFYSTGFVVLLCLKLFYSRAGSDELRWILAPTARWAGSLGGLSFAYEAQQGYINHEMRFIIASSCSGVQFMLVCMAALIYGCIHRMKTGKKKAVWLVGSVIFSYLLTVFVNGIRIVLAIYLPLRLEAVLTGGGWLTAQRLHTLIGIVVYFIALLVVYQAADVTAGIVEGEARYQHRRFKWAVPVFWYFSIVLGIPFLNGAWGKNRDGFAEYAVLVTIVTVGIILLLWLASAARNGRTGCGSADAGSGRGIKLP